jgi:hypothetical protein
MKQFITIMVQSWLASYASYTTQMLTRLVIWWYLQFDMVSRGYEISYNIIIIRYKRYDPIMTTQKWKLPKMTMVIMTTCSMPKFP